MRPPEFTGGNRWPAFRWGVHGEASMRPPEFTGGNSIDLRLRRSYLWRFNEAAGIHRRKPTKCAAR